MPALELIAGQVTDPSAVFTAQVALQGNSFTLRASTEAQPVFLLQIMNNSFDAVNLATTFSRIRSPLLHDNVRGITVDQITPGGTTPRYADGLLNPVPRQILTPQDTLTVEASVNLGTGGIIHTGLLIYYADLPGVEGTFITPDEVRERAVNVLTVENTIVALTNGQWGTAEAINAETDLLRANTPYAIVGYHSSIRGALVRYRASAWGNLGIGGPLSSLQRPTLRWFTDLSVQADLPLVPVFYSADNANILIDIATYATGANIVLYTHLVQLTP